jgi:hypothetical protein
MFVYGAVAELGSLAVQSVTKSLKNVARAFLVVVFLTKIVCDLWIRGLLQYIPHHAYSRARRLHSYIK